MQEKVDIMVITETKLKPNNRFKVPNFSIYRNDRIRNRGGGVAVLIRKSIPHHPLPAIESNIDNIAVKLLDGTVIVGAYNSPSNRITEEALSELFTHTKMLLVGDLNARHTTWSNRRNNRNGSTVFDYAYEYNIAVLAPDSPTHFPSNNSTPSIIDIILNKNYPHFIQPKSLPLLSSDHNPVHCTIQGTIENNRTLTKYDYKTTNWRKFKQILKERTIINNNLTTKLDIDEQVQKLTSDIQYARDKTTKTYKLKQWQVTIPDEIINLIKFKNKIKARWQNHRRQIDRQRLKDLELTIKDRLSHHREKEWNNKISQLTTHDNSLWRMSKLLRNNHAHIPTIIDNNETYSTDKDKADRIAHFLQHTNTTPPNSSPLHDNITQNANQIQNSYPIPPRKLAKLIISPSALQKIIKNNPNLKAPGPDNIPNLVLKNLPKKTLTQLSYLINSILRTQYYPESWKVGIVIPILKPNKPPHLTSSYRPITLLNTMSKITEKVILQILHKYINKKTLIPVRQFGFRSGHSTTLTVAHMIRDIIHGYNRKQCTVLLLLDIQRAFDTVWHNGLAFKLKNVCKFPDYIVALIRNFLKSRQIIVCVNGTYSDKIRISAGVPQGSILSPVLYNLYTSDIPTHPTSNILLYADDTVLYGQSFHAQTATQKIRYHLTKLLKFYRDWKIKINEDKTEMITFHRKFTNIKTITKLKIHNRDIEEKTVVKYLGVSLDTRLTFAPHITRTINKTYATLSRLYPLCNRRSLLTTDNKVTLYKVIFRPILTYACAAWNFISDTQCARLQRTQNKLLRLLTNSDRYIRITDLHRMTGLQTIREYITETAQKFFKTKIQHSELTRDLADVRRHHEFRHTHRLIHERLPIYEELHPD